MNLNKIFSLSFLLLLLTISCSSDDDSVSQSSAPILGEWQLDRIIFEGNEITLQPCEDLETYTFDAEGVFTIQLFEAAPEIPDEDCQPQSAVQGAWIIDDTETYFINLSGDFVELPVSIDESAGELTITEFDQATGMSQQRIFVLQNE